MLDEREPGRDPHRLAQPEVLGRTEVGHGREPVDGQPGPDEVEVRVRVGQRGGRVGEVAHLTGVCRPAPARRPPRRTARAGPGPSGAGARRRGRSATRPRRARPRPRRRRARGRRRARSSPRPGRRCGRGRCRPWRAPAPTRPRSRAAATTASSAHGADTETSRSASMAAPKSAPGRVEPGQGPRRDPGGAQLQRLGRAGPRRARSRHRRRPRGRSARARARRRRP